MFFQILNNQGARQMRPRSFHWPVFFRHLGLFNLAFVSSVLALVTMTGCGGGGSSDGVVDAAAANSTAVEQGEVVLALTDAEGDFLSYTVDVQSITLEKANGAVVETVPLNTRVDFTEYTDMTEFFTIATLPAGNYTQVNLNLDYSNADIIVQDSEGEYQAATVVDTEGEVVTDFSVQVNFSDTEVLTIRKGVPAKLTLDFDLDSSNSIVSYDPAVVEVTPIILADAQLDTEREHRSRGLLKAVDLDLATFEVQLKPFRHREGSFGSHTLHGSDTTQYEVNGEQLLGSAGLVALNNLVLDTPLIVYGSVSEDARFEAVYVLAGTSVPWVGRDVARGVVVAREGDVMTLRGSHIERSNGSVTFYDTVTVNLASSTQITRQTASDTVLTKDHVSIGQRVIVFGSMSSGAAGEMVLDATEGHVRMLMNLIKGEVLSLSPLTMDLRWLNGRRIALFDFDGTGVVTEQDADPDTYEVNAGALLLEGVELGDLIKVRGFPAAFGSAPDDFDAQTVVNINTEQRAGVMNIRWQAGGATAPFISTEQELLVLNVEDAQYQVKLAGVPFASIEDLINAPSVAPIFPTGRGVYAVKVLGQPRVKIYNSFGNYVTALNQHLTEGETLKRLVTLGRYDQVTDKMDSVVVTAGFLRETTAVPVEPKE